MKSVNLQITLEELSQFIDNQGDDTYQHVQKIMNSLGKHPIIPAFQTISMIGNSEVSDVLRRAKYFSIEGTFSSIICPDERIVFRRDEHDSKIVFLWENPTRYLSNFGFKSCVEIVFCLGDRYESSAAHWPYSRRLLIVHDKLQSFSKIIGSSGHNHLTDMFYIASCVTSIIVLSFKDPRNDFEEGVSILKKRNESTPFYRHIKLNFNNRAEVIPKDILYEFTGRIDKQRTVSIDFRGMNEDEELLNGTLRLDFIAKRSVLKFTKDLAN